MINHKFMPNFIIDIIRYADDKDIKMLLSNSKALSYQWYSQYTSEKDVSKGRLLACLFDYIYEFIEPELFIEPDLIVEKCEIMEEFAIPAPQNLANCITNHKLLYLHLYALSECYHSYPVYFPNKHKNELYKFQQMFAENGVNVIKTKVLTGNDIKKLLHMFITSYTENGFYYYFYDNELVKLEIRKIATKKKTDYKYIKTVYNLKDTENTTYITNNDIDININLKQKLLREQREKFAKININTSDTNFIGAFEYLFGTYDFQDIKNIHSKIISVLKITPKEKCKCCNPDINNPKSTKICNNCKKLFKHFQELQSFIDEMTGSTYLYQLKNKNIREEVYKININSKAKDINELQKKRKNFFNNIIRKIKSESEKYKLKDYSSNYISIMTIIDNLENLVADIFDD